LLDNPDAVRRTIMSATTDSGQETRFQCASPGIFNLLTLYESLTNEDRGSIEAKFAGKGYDLLKKEVIEVVLATIRPVQARYHEIMREPHATWPSKPSPAAVFSKAKGGVLWRLPSSGYLRTRPRPAGHSMR
jgi:tryptophanyl-tRNA synthetase